jgi:hypothetical protein
VQDSLPGETRHSAMCSAAGLQIPAEDLCGPQLLASCHRDLHSCCGMSRTPLKGGQESGGCWDVRSLCAVEPRTARMRRKARSATEIGSWGIMRSAKFLPQRRCQPCEDESRDLVTGAPQRVLKVRESVGPYGPDLKRERDDTAGYRARRRMNRLRGGCPCLDRSFCSLLRHFLWRVVIRGSPIQS